MILPAGAADLNADDSEREPSRTYRLDFQNGRVSGTVDDIEAVKQFILKQLLTDRFRHIIYTGNIGSEIQVGESSTNLASAISDALLVDDRITAITDFASAPSGDKLELSFTAVTIFGDAAMREVI